MIADATAAATAASELPPITAFLVETVPRSRDEPEAVSVGELEWAGGIEGRSFIEDDMALPLARVKCEWTDVAAYHDSEKPVSFFDVEHLEVGVWVAAWVREQGKCCLGRSLESCGSSRVRCGTALVAGVGKFGKLVDQALVREALSFQVPRG